MMLKLENSFADPDVAYRTIVEPHRNLTEAESASLNATLVLLLANHIGDLEAVAAAVKLAHQHLETKTRHKFRFTGVQNPPDQRS
jgi:hypothetical protein